MPQELICREIRSCNETAGGGSSKGTNVMAPVNGDIFRVVELDDINTVKSNTVPS